MKGAARPRARRLRAATTVGTAESLRKLIDSAFENTSDYLAGRSGRRRHHHLQQLVRSLAAAARPRVPRSACSLASSEFLSGESILCVGWAGRTPGGMNQDSEASWASSASGFPPRSSRQQAAQGSRHRRRCFPVGHRLPLTGVVVSRFRYPSALGGRVGRARLDAASRIAAATRSGDTSSVARRFRNQTFLFAASDVGAVRRRPTSQAMSRAGSAKRSAGSCVSTPGRPAAPPNAPIGHRSQPNTTSRR
jgi:hypothetical protein